jgi:hypothetical protein
MLFTFRWVIWKERNRGIFEHKEISAQCLAVLIQEAILLNHSALALCSVVLCFQLLHVATLCCLYFVYSLCTVMMFFPFFS